MAIVEISGLEVAYGDFKALQGLDLHVDGGTIGLLGPNGAGKSTLMKTMLGFNRASSGYVKLFGLDMPKHALEVRQRLGYMPEREISSPNVSAVSFLTYCGRLIGMNRIDAMERAHEVLNYVGLGESRYRRMETYSTGMLQRVKLAQALIHDPKLLLLDEPTNGLDPVGRISMLELIKDIAVNRKVTILLSSHLLPDVQHVCDRVVMIYRGRIVRQGSLEELTSRQLGRFEVRVRDRKEEFIAHLGQHGFECTDLHNGDLLVTSRNGLSSRNLFEAAQGANTQIRHFRPLRQTLEEVFLEAIGKKV